MKKILAALLSAAVLGTTASAASVPICSAVCRLMLIIRDRLRERSSV